MDRLAFLALCSALVSLYIYPVVGGAIFFSDCDPLSDPLDIAVASNDSLSITNCSVGRISIDGGVSNCSVTLVNVAFANGAGGAAGWAVIVMKGYGVRDVNLSIVNSSLASTQLVERLIAVGDQNYSAGSNCTADVTSLRLDASNLEVVASAGTGFIFVSLGCYMPSKPALANSTVSCVNCNFFVSSSSFAALGGGTITLLAHQDYTGGMISAGGNVLLKLTALVWAMLNVTIASPQSTNNFLMIGVVPVTDVGVVVSCINASITVVNSRTTGYGLLTVVSPLVFSSTSPTPLTSFGIELQNTMVVMSRLTAVINSHIVLMQGPNVLLPGLCSITNFSVSLDLMNISSPLPGPNCLTLVQIRNVSSVLFTLSRSVALGTFVAMIDQSNATDVMMRLNTSKVVSGGLVNQTVRTLFSNLTQFSLSGVGCEIVVVGQNTFLFGAFVTGLRSASVRFVDNNVSTLGNIWISQSTTSDMNVALVNSSNGARTFIFYSFMSNLVRFLLIVTGSRSVSLGFCAMYLTVTALTDSQFLFVDCGITVATSFFYMADRSPISGNVQFLISRSQLTFPNVNFMMWKSSAAASLPSSLLSVTVEDSTLAVYTFLVLDMVGRSSAVIVSNSSVEVNPNGNIVAYSSASSGSSAHVSRSTISGGVYLVTSTFALSDLLVLLVDSNILNVQLLAYIYHALLSNITLRLVNTSVAAAFTWGIVLISSGVAGTGQIALEAGSVIRAAGIGIFVGNFAPIVQSGNGSSFLDGVLLYISNSTIVGPTNCFSMTQTNKDSFGILLAGATLQSYAVVFDAQLSSTTQLNLTVVDGTIAYGSFTISCPYLAATFTNSTILLSNQSTSASFIFANCSSSNITLSRCNFTQTSLGGAGSVVIVNNTASTLTLTVQECVLQGPSVIVRSTKSSASATLALHVPGGLINATRQPDGGCCLLSEDPVASISITVESATIVATGGSLPNMFVVSLVPVPVLSLTMISSEIVSSSGSSSLVTPMNVSSSFSLLMFNVTAHCEVKGRCPCVVNCTSCAERISLVLDRTNFSGFTRFVALPPQAAVGPVAQMNGSIELYCSRWDARWLSRKLQFHALDTYYATAEFPKSLADPFYRCPKLDSASGSVSTLTSTLTRFTASPTIPARSLSSSQSQTGTGSTSISSTLTVTGSSSETIASTKSSSSTFSTTGTLVVTPTRFGTSSDSIGDFFS